MLFHFPLMQAMYLGLARHDARPVARALQASAASRRTASGAFRPQPRRAHPGPAEDREREEVFEAFGPDEEMPLFGRGLRRRLPTMLDGDDHRLRLPSIASCLPAGDPGPVLRGGDRDG